MAVPAAGGLNPRALVASLADGAVHSGERLAERLGVSRTAVWKGIERLRADGMPIEAVARRGYRLPASVELLDEHLIRAALDPSRRHLLRTLEVPFEVDSTNTRLLGGEPPPFGQGDACSCELQRAGRGRRGRSWIAPFGDAIALSLGWQFRGMPRDLSALSLATGVVVARALARAGARGIGLKWPNDVWLDDAKIGGILIDLRAEADGPVHVVIGVGLNLRLSAQARAAIAATGARAAALADACPTPPSRNRTAGTVLDGLLGMLERFDRAGFAPYRDEWNALDVLAGRRAAVSTGRERLLGVARGIDSGGALQLEVGGIVQKFLSGDVSLRPEGDVQ